MPYEEFLKRAIDDDNSESSDDIIIEDDDDQIGDLQIEEDRDDEDFPIIEVKES